ncbi:MAG: hypothetical protein H7226_12920 [Salinibacterium sp.]|nr:hypothetical protein [Salinibacterium sp.]
MLASRSDLRSSTLDRVNGAIGNHIVPELGRIALGDLERLQIQQWASGLSVKQEPASVRKIVNVLSGALQLASIMVASQPVLLNASNCPKSPSRRSGFFRTLKLQPWPSRSKRIARVTVHLQ